MPSPLLRFALVASFVVLATNAFAEKPDTTRRPWGSKIIGTPQPPEPYKIVPAFPKLTFERPTSIEQVPDAKRLLVTEMGGKIFTIAQDAGATEKALVVDLKQTLAQEFAGKGVSLFDAEFHPKYSENRYLFVCYVHPDKLTRVSRIKLDGKSPPKMLPDSEQVIIDWPSGGHNAGCLEFGKDGYLYIATGDGSGPNPPDGLTTGQDVSDLLGSILRIDVNVPSNKQAYSVPSDNPFIDIKDAKPEIWAYGLRNPWKFGTDPQTGDIFAADNGWETWELVHRIVRGGNCGWPTMEGRAALRTEVKVGPTPILPPVKDHPHTEANSVIGGPVYRGEKLRDLQGSFIYGDYITGTIWSVKREASGSYSHATLCDTDQRIVAFTEGAAGELYVLDYDYTGQIYEIQPSGLKDNSAKFPRRLSETGLFAAMNTLDPAVGVVPYTVVAERWMDGAEAERFIAIPDKGVVKLAKNKDEASVFPEGTVLVKHLSIGRGIRLETQLLHFENGKWHPYSYLWDEQGLEAHLVDSIGAQRTFKVPDKSAERGFVERTWRVSAVNECKLCHNAESRNVLGFNRHQLMNPVRGSAGATELTHLYAIKAIEEEARVKEDDPLRLVRPHDEKEKIDDRARSYLHANCSMCHQPGGNAIVSFYLRRDLPFDKLNTNKGTGIGTFGLKDAKLIIPGDPYRSVLMYRMSKLGYARMPYIGSQVVDSQGVALVDAWIRSLGEGADAPAEAKAVTEAMRDGSAEQRREKLDNLAENTGGALALAAAIHSGAVSGEDRKIAVAAGLKQRSDIRGLFETFIPESQRRPTLGPSLDPKLILAKTGDLERGKLIYFSDGARCRNCHDASDKAQSIGPTIAEINKKYPAASDLLQHVLQPSLKVDEPFAAYTVLTDDGRVIAGMLVEQSEEQVVLKTAEKKVVALPRKNIEEIKRSDKSLMPDGLFSDLTAQEAADLVTYLKSLK